MPPLTDALSSANRSRLAVKVPQITVGFWAVKIISTATGEALSDFLDNGSGFWPILGVLAALIAFLVALRAQLRVKRYSSYTYWATVAMVATFGTMAADAPHKALGIPYVVVSASYAVALGLIFWLWQHTEGTISIHSIVTPQREWFYWATVLATFALGTAVGDWTAVALKLGFFSSALLFTGLILIPLVAYRFTSLSPILTFWTAYVLTRPLGASYADWMDVPKRHGGLAWGRGPVALVLLVVISALVLILNRTGRDVASDYSE